MRSAVSALLVLASAAACASEVCGLADAQLTNMVAADQAARSALRSALDRALPPEQIAGLAAALQSADRENTAAVKQSLLACGWPKGAAASHDMWLLVQHADRDREFQLSALQLLRTAVSEGYASPRDLAYLEDRAAVAVGEKQLYGTQLTQPDRCSLELRPVDDERKVEERRSKLGLPPLSEYIANARSRAIPKDCPVQQR